MNSLVKFVYAIGFMTLLLNSCKDKTTEVVTGKPDRDKLIEINKELIIKDRERIINYINRKDLNMEESETGLWYNIEIPGSGKIDQGKTVTLEYKMFLLDGTLCYSSDNDGIMSVSIDRTDMPAGLNEGLQLLGDGGEAAFIVPSYLGYGIVGDSNRIPGRSILVYKVKVISVK